MKITKVQIFNNKFATGLRVYTDEGIFGDGEVAHIHHNWASYGMMRDLASRVIGMDPFGNEVIWDQLNYRTFWGQNGGSIWYAGIGALDTALWDIKSKALNVPLYQLLGGKKREEVRCYASQLQFGWSGEREVASKLEDYVNNAKKAVAEGYDAIKIDFFTYDEDGNRFTELERMGQLEPKYVDLVHKRVAAVREAVGPSVDIIMENHCYTDTRAAIQLANVLEPYNLFYFEEPNTPVVYNNKVISDNITQPISHGERLFGRWEYLPFFEDGSVAVIQPDLGNCGGITEVKKICDLAHVFDVGVQIHTCSTHLLTPPSIIMECVIPNFVIHEHHVFCLHEGYRNLTTKVYDPKGGKLKVVEEPGIGNSWNDRALATEEQITIE